MMKRYWYLLNYTQVLKAGEGKGTGVHAKMQLIEYISFT